MISAREGEIEWESSRTSQMLHDVFEILDWTGLILASLFKEINYSPAILVSGSYFYFVKCVIV